MKTSLNVQRYVYYPFNVDTLKWSYHNIRFTKYLYANRRYAARCRDYHSIHISWCPFTGFYVLTISYNSRMLVINYHYQQEKRMKKAMRRLWCHVFKTCSLNLTLLTTWLWPGCCFTFIVCTITIAATVCQPATWALCLDQTCFNQSMLVLICLCNTLLVFFCQFLHSKCFMDQVWVMHYLFTVGKHRLPILLSRRWPTKLKL